MIRLWNKLRRVARSSKADGKLQDCQKKRNPMPWSCCASFIMPGSRIARYPLEFYRDMRRFLTNATLDHGVAGLNADHFFSRTCWEFVVWDFFGDDLHDSKDQLQQWYSAADGLGSLDAGRLSRCRSKCVA
mmetsp:Transcript_130207/g.417908  ORF Transcript_130207/g.417908 Transcript_130207/m.417908 type:complete len:131 (-) Transcript_130207:90-482(-)